MVRQHGCVQELTKSLEVLRRDSEASRAALREARVALEDRDASSVQRESALEAGMADLEARNDQLTTQAEASHSECCRYGCIRQEMQSSIHHAQDGACVVCSTPSILYVEHSLNIDS